MGKYFGTDGFRGEANVSLTAEHAYKIGRFLGWYYSRQKQSGDKCRIVIGKDTRRSSYMFEFSLVSGLTASGADVYLLHVTTTPSVSYVTMVDAFDCGIMISASHNPYYDNGIKLIGRSGAKMDEDTIALIEAYIDGDMAACGAVDASGAPFSDLPYAVRDQIGCTVDYSAGRNRYIGYLISLAIHSFRGKRIGLDCANGSAWMIGKAVFDALGAQTYVIGAQPNGLNINMDAGSTHIENLQEYVVRNKLDAGFAFDGDADRCIAVDENGKIIDGDLILYICGTYMKSRGALEQNTVVTTVMSNFGLYKAFDAVGIAYEKTAVGDKNVYDCMQQHGYRLGGEQSGHIIFSKYAATGDGILTSLMLMEVMLSRKLPLSKLAEAVQIYPQTLRNIVVADKAAALADPAVQAQIAAAAQQLGDTGRILVRESGTEPKIRVMVEAPEQRLCDDLVDSVIAAIRNGGHAV